MVAALTALANRPAEISVTQLDAMAVSLAAYEADGWARVDRRRCAWLGLACGVLCLSALAGAGAVLAVTLKLIVTVVTSGVGGKGMALGLKLPAALAFTAFTIWAQVRLNALETRILKARAPYVELKDQLRPLRGWSLNKAKELSTRTGRSQELYDVAMAQGISLRGYHFGALQLLAANAGCRCASDDDDYDYGGGIFGTIIVIVDLLLILSLATACAYHWV